MSQGDDKTVRCSDECGAKVADVAEAEAKGWERLAITNRYRCTECRAALERVNRDDV